MTLHQREQRLERLTDPLPAALEALGDELGEVDVGERCEVDRTRLTVERTAAVTEEVIHHADVRAGEGVARGLGVVLDLAPDHGIDPLLGGEHVLELVEDDEDPAPVTFVQSTGKGEAVDERGGRRLQVDLQAGGDRATADAHGGSKLSS